MPSRASYLFIPTPRITIVELYRYLFPYSIFFSFFPLSFRFKRFIFLFSSLLRFFSLAPPPPSHLTLSSLHLPLFLFFLTWNTQVQLYLYVYNVRANHITLVLVALSTSSLAITHSFCCLFSFCFVTLVTIAVSISYYSLFIHFPRHPLTRSRSRK